MSAEQEGKTEAPSEKRLAEASSKGQIAKAPELGMAAALLAVGLLLQQQGERVALSVAEITVGLFRHLDPKLVQMENASDWCSHTSLWLASLALPLLAVGAVASVGAGLAQSRLSLAFEALAPSFDKLDPAAGCARLFSAAGLVRVVLDAFKLAVAVALLWGGVKALLLDPIFFTPVAPERLGGLLQSHAVQLLVRIAGATALLGGLHYAYQWRKTQKELSMTHHEVKEEMREANGDPMVKMIRRQMARRLLQKQMLAAVPTADVVITNPTHFAVALRYERGRDEAPVVLAKGEGAFAQRIKALALEHSVPTVENRPVARALFKYGQVGQAIPGPLYRAVAEILGYVYRTHRYYFHRLKARRLEAEGKRT